MDAFRQFLADPMVQALVAVAVLSLGTFVLTVYRSISGGTFDAAKVPKIIDTLILRRLVPLSVLGIAALATPAGVTHDALVLAYLGGALVTAASELTQFLTALRDTGLPELPMTDSPDG